MSRLLSNALPVFLFLGLTCPGLLQAARLISIQPIDNQCLLIHWQDGWIEYNHDDTTSGSCNGWDYYYTETWSLCPDKDQYIPFGKPLNTAVIADVRNFRIFSEEDPTYGSNGMLPTGVYRKSKVWEASIDENRPAMHHFIYLLLPEPLQQGSMYKLELDTLLQSDLPETFFTFDVFKEISPAIRISHLGYERDAPFKSADLYMWMGDGGGRDFGRFTGTDCFLLDTLTNNIAYTGKLTFRMDNKKEPRYDKDLTGAAIWECDFSDFSQPGTYRLVIPGIGSSDPFVLGNDIFQEAFRVAMQGMFYQRMGCEESPKGDYPRARRPLFRQGVEPADFTVHISSRDMVTGVNPDNREWYSEELSGEIATTTWGGWCDAYDNDQRPVNFICVFDLLLTYYLDPGSFTDNQLYIPEHQNGIPDIIDEALWEIDWWLRMRDKKGGYLTGLTNIRSPENTNYAGAPCAWQGWCVAAGSAMVADCFRLAGLHEWQKRYTAAAKEAFEWAADQQDQMLETDVSGLRGKDLQMTAAAFLFNLTGNSVYEKIVAENSEVSGPDSRIRNMGKWEQQYASIAYVLAPRAIHYKKLQENMRVAFIQQAKTDYVDHMKDSPTKAARNTSSWEGMVQTSNEMSVVAIAHRLSSDPKERLYFERGLFAESEWTLGRNPLGLVQMTGLTDKCLTQTFAPGRRDGYPGVTPGWTPYMCRDGWGNEDHIVRCEWYTNRNYPADKEAWPWGEHFWNSRYSVPNSESTPHQNFRQKVVLYGYLHSLFSN